MQAPCSRSQLAGEGLAAAGLQLMVGPAQQLPVSAVLYSAVTAGICLHLCPGSLFVLALQGAPGGAGHGVGRRTAGARYRPIKVSGCVW